MTSSLVGSEMCIRDRSFSKEGYVPTQCHEEPSNWGDWGKITSIIKDRPVSYTHLTLPTICSV
eukprot:12808579-Prorocentrum_lima.AAC.1